LNSTQQILDRLAASTQDSIDALRKMNPEIANTSPEVSKACELIREADNSKHLLSSLHDVTNRGEVVDAKLRQVSTDLSAFIATHVAENMDMMINTSGSSCPSVTNETKLRAHLSSKTKLNAEFMETLVNDQVGQDIHNKINELNLIMANHISDRVIDEVIDSLTNSGKFLNSQVGSTKKKRSLTPDVLKNRSVSVSESLEQESMISGSDATSQKSEPSPISTPQTSKRKLQGRKMRPSIAVVDDSPDLLTSTPKANGASNSSSEIVDTVPELPSSTALTHLGKARPKRPKKHAPTRGAVVSRPVGNDQDSSVDEGMDKFYSGNNSFSPSSSPAGSSPLIDEIPRMGSISSNSSLLKASKEDLSCSSLERSSKAKLGMSCLASSTTDEDTSALVKSPVQSISDIFAKSASAKVANKGKDEIIVTTPVRSASPLVKKDARPPLAEEERTSSPDQDGKKTPDDLVRRHGVGHGKNPGLLAEMKEKRASMAVKMDEEKTLTTSSNPSTSVEKTPTTPSSSGLFSGVKLRSTGLAANLTSPTNEFSASPMTTSTPKDIIDEKQAKEEQPKGSIVGLRSSKFNLEKKASPSPEAKPRSSTSTLPTSTAVEDPPVTSNSHFNPKPKPLPKPRPWSIVGVDRKSGEVTSVDTNEKQPTMTAPNDKPKSVRDMINNMNKDGSTSVNAGETSKKKGSSLPRGTQAPTGSEISANSSPKTGKKTDSTSDDPRILKLDDDYAYEGVMDV